MQPAQRDASPAKKYVSHSPMVTLFGPKKQALPAVEPFVTSWARKPLFTELSSWKGYWQQFRNNIIFTCCHLNVKNNKKNIICWLWSTALFYKNWRRITFYKRLRHGKYSLYFICVYLKFLWLDRTVTMVGKASLIDQKTPIINVFWMPSCRYTRQTINSWLLLINISKKTFSRSFWCLSWLYHSKTCCFCSTRR